MLLKQLIKPNYTFTDSIIYGLTSHNLNFLNAFLCLEMDKLSRL